MTPTARMGATKEFFMRPFAQLASFAANPYFVVPLHACNLECCEHARVSEWNTTETNAGRIVDRVGDRRDHGFAYRLAGAIWRKIGPVWIGISVYQHDVDSGRRVGVRERGMRSPVHASDLFGVELHFLVQ